jgi:hypothetical protein
MPLDAPDRCPLAFYFLRVTTAAIAAPREFFEVPFFFSPGSTATDNFSISNIKGHDIMARRFHKT